MKSTATTVPDYLAELPDDRRAAIETVRGIVLANLPAGYVEAMNWGMISYEVPLEVSGRTYNGKPLMYVALGNQKRHMALYLCGLYCKPEIKKAFEESWAASGKKLDMGAACVRFKSLEDLHIPAVEAAISAVSMADFITAAPKKK
ncbi:MAG: DUF1801 domain-containing protein [Rhizobiales bacterium]|nr:DUF1801 domain-containing protein [Hyphomicrobiales bacterium]